jgi:hypothetical protein
MAVVKVRNLWTAFITAFFAVLAALGLTSPAAATGSSLQQPADQPADRSADRVAPAPAAPVPAREADPGARAAAGARAGTPARMADSAERDVASPARDLSLPPTIKQRISAEAHGSSPSVRRLPADVPSDDLTGWDSAAADLVGAAVAAHGAA